MIAGSDLFVAGQCDIKLNELHEVIQVVMGWLGGHLHEFQINNLSYKIPDPD